MSLQSLFVRSFEDHEHIEAFRKIVEGVVFFLDGLQVRSGHWWRGSIPRNPVIRGVREEGRRQSWLMEVNRSWWRGAGLRA